MKRLLDESITAGVIILLTVPMFAQSGMPSAQELVRLLPEQVGDWEKTGAYQLYLGDDLFQYINGGAEIYHEYGFHSVVVQDYRRVPGEMISLEIYRMRGPESAYGIYTFKRSRRGRALEMGDEARLEDYYLNLWKGSYLVTLTGFDEQETTLAGLQVLAREVSQRIEISAERPPLIGLLPEDDLIPGSRKHFKGPLGLFNSYRFSRENIFAVESGARGDYAGGRSLLVFAYSDPDRANGILHTAREAFSASSEFNLLAKEPGNEIHMQDVRGTVFHVKQIREYLLVSMQFESAAPASELMRELEARVRKFIGE
jgi:hypothetical protein